jgi:orotate phosphoribosyltransferase
VRQTLGLRVCAIATVDDLLGYLQTQSGDAMGSHRARVQAYRERYGVS